MVTTRHARLREEGEAPVAKSYAEEGVEEEMQGEGAASKCCF
jgi:hypothetical protein